MSINIFQGGTNRGSKGKAQANSASKSVRAKFANDALRGASVASDSGNTAITIPGTLGKVAKTVGNVAGLVSKFVPGTAGTIAGAISNLLNDPEWWRQVPGDAVTMNVPLRAASLNDLSLSYVDRCSLVEIYNDPNDPIVIKPTDAMITQYLMPEIRKVVNAIPLQAAADYAHVLSVNATVYALWHTLKKWLFITEHGKTYMASLDDPAFPMLQVENSDKLKAYIGRLEEYMRSSVRLPHTLCDYLAFRYGRVYLTRKSAKSAWIMYNVAPVATDLNTMTALINMLVTATSSNQPYQQANTDIYNAYFDHDMQVEVREDTQFTYDDKEYMLRTNLDLDSSNLSRQREDPNPVYIDSAQDNPTVFMASTVSTVGRGTDGLQEVLFPVKGIRVYTPNYFGNNSNTVAAILPNRGKYTYIGYQTNAGSKWIAMDWDGAPISIGASSLTPINANNDYAEATVEKLCEALFVLHVLKMCDVYNKDIYISMGVTGESNRLVELSSPSTDMALVPDQVIANEHVYAFANLVHIDRKRSMSYGQAEKMVAKAEANLIDDLSVAAVK